MADFEADALFSQDAEESVVGAALIAPDVLNGSALQPEHFYLIKHQYIWQALLKLHRAEMGIDFVTVVETLDRSRHLAEIGGPAYLTRLIGGTPSAMAFEEYARIVMDYSRRRAWRDLAGKLARVAFDRSANLEQEAPAIANDLFSTIQSEGAALPIGEYVDGVLQETTERMRNPQDIWGMATGFSVFDHITGGLQPGEILGIAGEPGVGKSILASQMAFQMAEKGKPAVMYSLEMPARQVIRRHVSSKASVPTRSIKTGRLELGQFESLSYALDALRDLPLYMSDSTQWTTASLRADLARLKQKAGVQAFVLDYAYLLQDGSGLSENDRTGLISAQLKSICRSLDLAGIIIQSLNKGGMTGGGSDMPRGVNLRGSGQQFYDADLLLFLTANKDQPNVVDCHFGKGRELEKSQQKFQLVRKPGFPALADYQPEPIDSPMFPRKRSKP